MIPRSASGPQTILSAITLVLLGVLSCIWSQTGPLLSFLSFSRLHPTVNGSCTSSVVQLAQLAPSKPYVLCRESLHSCAPAVGAPPARQKRMDRMVVQASQKSLAMLADSFTCNGLQRACSMQSPFITQMQQPAAATSPPDSSSCSGIFLQQLTSYQLSHSGSSMHQHQQQHHHPQVAPVQMPPPSRTMQRGPHLPQLRTLRSRQLSGRLYSVQSAGGVQTIEEPIVVACSWLGAKQGPFAKYKQLWHSLGYNRILAARPPMTSIMFPIQGQLLAANFTHKLLQKAQQHPKAPILIHLFSGGGFIFMGWVFQLLAELDSAEADAVRARIAGIILDSSPAMVTADVSSRALVAAALGRPAEGIEQELPWLVRPAAAIVDGYLRLPYVKDALVGMDKAWMQQAPVCPKLFLYSDADVLVQPHVVEGFMEQQRKRGAPTYAYKWRDSAHVDHYRKYPEEYRRQLEMFAQQVLSSWALHAGKQPEGV